MLIAKAGHTHFNRKYKVLIVDINGYVGEIIKFAEKSFDNIEIISVLTIEQALEMLKSIDLDAMIINYVSEETPFIDFIASVKERKNILPTIVLTGCGELVGAQRLELIKAGTTFIMEKPFTVDEVMAIVSNLLELNEIYRELEHSENIITALTRAIESRDPYTKGHAEAVAKIAVTMFDQMGLRGEQRDDLFVGCLLHDIGKIGIPDSVLNSTEALSEEEFKEIKKHPVSGHRICKDLHKIKPSLQIILQHHERLDGSGYPHGHTGAKINILAQICAVADVYHSLVSNRSYRKGMKRKEALEVLDDEVNKGKLNSLFVGSLKIVLKNGGLDL